MSVLQTQSGDEVGTTSSTKAPIPTRPLTVPRHSLISFFYMYVDVDVYVSVGSHRFSLTKVPEGVYGFKHLRVQELYFTVA